MRDVQGRDLSFIPSRFGREASRERAVQARLAQVSRLTDQHADPAQVGTFRRPPAFQPALARRLPADLSALSAQIFAAVGFVILSEAPISFFLKTGLAASLGPAINVLWITVFFIGLVGVFSFWSKGLTTILASLAVVTLLVINNFVSMLWSVDPGHSFRIASFFVGTVLFGAWLGAHCRSWAEFARFIAKASLALAIVSALLAVGPGKIGVMQEIHPGAWSGLWDEKNRFGAMLAVGVVCSVASWFARPSWGWVAAALFMAVCIILARSSTALLASVMGSAVVVLMVIWSNRPGLGLWLAYLGVCAFTVLVSIAVFAPGLFAQLLGRDPTFTSRTDIWALVQTAIADRPVLGWGYGAFWRIDPSPGDILREELGFKVMNAHNSWLDLWLESGLVGLGLAILAVVVLFVAVLRAGLLVRHAGLGLGLLALMMIYSFSETILFQANGYQSMLFAALAVRTAMSLRKTKHR